jgi:putative transposase
MGKAIFRSGQAVRIDGVEFTLLRSFGETGWQVEQKSTRRVSEYEREEIHRLMNQGRFAFCAPDNVKAIGKLQIQLPEGLSEDLKKRRMYAKAFLENRTRETQEEAIKRIHVQLKGEGNAPSHTTVFRWAWNLRRSGGDARVLAKQNHKKGNRTERYSLEVLDICMKAIREIYMKRERGTIADTLEKAIVGVTRENEQRPEEFQLPKPSRKFIRKLINRIDAFDVYAARHGRDAALRHFRTVLGHVVAEAPLDRVEIDTTRLDVFVVSEEGIPLGRPWLSIAIDVFTRSILAIVIEFVPPSYITIAKTVKQIVLPKSRLKEEFPEVKNKWIQHGVPYAVVLDNALENHMESLDDVFLALGVIVQYAPRKTGWFKPYVERSILTLNSKIPHNLPGTTFSNIIEKGDYDPALHAVVRLSTMKTGIVRWVVDVYHQRPHASLETTPQIMWETSISEDDIPLPDESVNLDALLGRKHFRTLTHRGIDFASMQYNSPEMGKLRRRLGTTLDVTIKVDEEDLGHIHVISPDSGVFYKVPSLRQEYASGLTLFQHEVFRKYRRERLAELNDDPDGWMVAKQEILEMLERDGLVTRRRRKMNKRVARFEAGKKNIRDTSPPELIANVISMDIDTKPDAIDNGNFESAEIPRTLKYVPLMRSQYAGA